MAVFGTPVEVSQKIWKAFEGAEHTGVEFPGHLLLIVVEEEELESIGDVNVVVFAPVVHDCL